MDYLEGITANKTEEGFWSSCKPLESFKVIKIWKEEKPGMWELFSETNHSCP